MPDSEDVVWRISIPCNNGRDYLTVNYWYPGKESILFYSLYGCDGEEQLDWLKANNPGAFDSPTAEKDGIKFYQLIDFYLCDFVIVIDDYILWSIHQERQTPEEKLEEIVKFSFVRLDSSGNEKNVAVRIFLVVFISILMVLGCALVMMFLIK